MADITGSWKNRAHGYSLTITATGPRTYGITAKVGNTMWLEVTYDEDSRVFSAGSITSTRALDLDPERRALENSVVELLSGITNIAREGNQLVVTAGDRSERFDADTN